MKLTVWKTNNSYSVIDDYEEKLFKTPEAAIKFLSAIKTYATCPNVKNIRYRPKGFENCTNTHYEFQLHNYIDKDGYFEISSGEPVLETQITDNQDVIVTWEYPIFVQFFKAHYNFQPEIKEPGKPYVPEKRELIIDSASEKYPLYKSYDDYSYSSDMGSWQRGVPVVECVNLYASKVELDILE